MSIHPLKIPSKHESFIISDALVGLRKATAIRHKRLDKCMPLSKVNPTLGDYYHHLTLLRIWLQPIEKWQESFFDGPQGLEAPVKINRTKLIDIDLKNIPHYYDQNLSFSYSSNWSLETKVAYRWGVSYVVEGAQLGGMMLYKRLTTLLSGQSCFYLQGEQGGPGPRWKHFLQIMGENLQTEVEIEDACRGACDAFDELLSLQSSYFTRKIL